MKIVKNILLCLLLAVSLLYVFVIVSTRLYPNFYPFGIRMALVLTDSMSPVLNADDFVVIKRAEDINVDDIIVYKESDTNNEIIHRVIKIDDDEIITKGDANNTADKPIVEAQVRGKLIWKSSFIGKIVSFMIKPIGFSFLITFFVIIMLIPSKEKNES